MPDKMGKRCRFCFLASLAVYVIAVIIYCVWSNHRQKDDILDKIDRELMLAATGLKYMLAEDFHDRALEEDSISFAEEMQNRRNITGFANDTPFTYVYTLVERDGRFYFSAPTVTEEEGRERKSWYFYPYEDVPAQFVKAYEEKKITFHNYADQWGHFRSVAIPQTSPGGRTYLACADYEIRDLKELLRHNLLIAVLTAGFFLLSSLPLILCIRNFFTSYNRELQEMNDELTEHRTHLADLVTERTARLQETNRKLSEELVQRQKIEADLQVEKNKLEKALAQVKTLSGFLPICTSCKKIRDDKGYWNQIESYIRDHSEAQLSHSICPDCFKRLYPEMAEEMDE